jgi:hypothetical protein
VKNHLTVTSLQPRGLVALISSLGTFSASWHEIEELNLEIENNERSYYNNNDSNNYNNNNNNDIKLITNNEDNKSNSENMSKNENKNEIGNNRNTLSFVFSETAERYFPDLSNAEVFQVRQYSNFSIFIVFFLLVFHTDFFIRYDSYFYNLLVFISLFVFHIDFFRTRFNTT